VSKAIVGFRLGDRDIEVLVDPMTPLQRVLRDDLGYTGAKEGCGQGGCGSCTVLVDGEPRVSCLLPTEDVAGRRVETIETRTPTQGVSRLQQAFLDENALQCGYCTPGFIMVATALLELSPHPAREEILDAIAGNVCRCTGYEPIVAAIEAAATSVGESASGQSSGAEHS
jgi:carbon-monoxide dehydrogenase small subunit